MADKLPGTEMEVFEKYPLSRRLDHPDFGDVSKTTYAKGVITEFKKTADDPITVESMVKVTGDFGESDYIPIFYHQKEGYWDDELATPPVLATDFDEELGCHKQAWMSFRCADEVVVMLKEGTPVAVVAHADGVPRIGEDIIALRMDGSGGYWPLDPNPYYVSITKAQKTVLDDPSFNHTIANPSWSAIQYWTISDKGPDGLDYGLVKDSEVFRSGLEDQHEMCVWPVVVGPIVYAIYALFELSETYLWLEYLMIKAGIYTPELYEAIGNSIGSGSLVYASHPPWTRYDHWDWPAGEDMWPGAPDGLILQKGLSMFLDFNFRWNAGKPDMDLSFYYGPEPFHWLTRPHTKEELQAAGMWPVAEE